MKSMKKVLILCSLLFCLSFIKPKQVDTVVRDDPGSSWVKQLQYPHPNIDTAYINTYLYSNGKNTLRGMQMYCKLKDYELQVVEIMFKVRIFRVTNPNISWYIYPRIKIYSLAGAGTM